MLDEELQAFRDGKFRLEFEEVHFRPDAASKKPAFVGPGTAKQESDGTIKIECRQNLPPPEELRGKTFELRADPPGTIYTEKDFYEIEARDREGRLWTASRVLVSEQILPPSLRETVSCATHFLRYGKGSAVCAMKISLEFFNENRND